MPPRAGHGGVRVVVAIVVLLAGSAFVQAGPGTDPGGEAPVLRAEPMTPGRLRARAPRPAPRVLIFGDSIADQAGSYAAFALRQSGVDTRLMTLWGRGLFSRDQYDMGVSNPDPPAGTLMAAASQTVAEFDPDLVVVYTNHNYWPPYARDAAGREIPPHSPAFAPMAQAQLTELTRRLTAGGASVYLVEPIPVEVGTTAADNEIWAAYQGVRERLGLGVIEAGRAVAAPDGTRVETMADCSGKQAEVRPNGDLHLTAFGSGRVGSYMARRILELLGLPRVGIEAPTDRPAAMLPLGRGYRLVTCDGATFPAGFGAEAFGGVDLGIARPPGDPVVAATVAPSGDAVWAVTAGGHVLGSGPTPLLGDVMVLAPGERAVGIAPTRTGRGYWIATSCGRVEAFGDAEDLPGQARRARRGNVVAMAGTPDRRGYWLLLASGKVAAFGTAERFGDLAASPPAARPVAIAPHPGGDGYWILDQTGDVHAFGAARNLGSAAAQPMVRMRPLVDRYHLQTYPIPAADAPTRAVAMLPTASGDGYWVWLGNGAVCQFGDAGRWGGIHRAEVDWLMVLLDMPFYGEDSPCARGDASWRVSQAEIQAAEKARLRVL